MIRLIKATKKKNVVLLMKKGERSNITNYRPITLLNTDYKVMTKALANKLAEVAPTLIHKDQASFVRGRSIFNQVKLAKLAVDYGSIMGVNGSPFSEKNSFEVGSYILKKSQPSRDIHCCTTGVHPLVVGDV